MSVRTTAACFKASARDLGAADFATINRYSSDPDFRAAMDAEREVERDRCNAAIDAGVAKYRAGREAAMVAKYGTEWDNLG